MPIVEPEMTLGAGEYTIEDTSYWSERVLTHVFRHLNEHDVMLEGILMKPSMCLPGESLLICSAHAVLYHAPSQKRFQKERKRKSTPSGVMTGASVPRSSPRLRLHIYVASYMTR